MGNLSAKYLSAKYLSAKYLSAKYLSAKCAGRDESGFNGHTREQRTAANLQIAAAGQADDREGQNDHDPEHLAPGNLL